MRPQSRKVRSFTFPLIALASLLALQCLPTGSALASTPPYPPSGLITAMTWDFNTVQALRKAGGSDLWPLAWAADGNLYGAWGDGGGFDGDSNNIGRVSLGFARITGTPVAGEPASYAGKNVWGAAPQYAQYPATFGGKVDDLISVDGVLYGQGSLWTAANCNCPNPVLKSGGNPASHTIVWSADLGKTWQIAPWNADSDSGATLQYGRDYQGAADPDHVYYYYMKDGSVDPSHVYLRRIRRDAIAENPATSGHFEYLVRLDEQGTPTWSAAAQEALPIFFDPGMPAGTANLAVVYDAPLRRYLLATTHGSYTGQMGFFEAPAPWGPWSTIGYYDDWGGFNESAGPANGLGFPPKWISADGKTLWGVFSGVTNGFDSFNVVKVVLTVAASPGVAANEVGRWEFDEGSGSVAADSSGRGSAGRLLNGPRWTVGHTGYALSFDAGRAAVEIPGSGSIANLHLHGFTASAWIKPRSSATGSRIFDKITVGAGWLLKMNRGALQFTGLLSGASVIRYGMREVVLDQWQHVAVTWDGSANAANVHLYLNGEQVDGALRDGDGSASDDSAVPLTIGNRASSFNNGFDGVIDDVRVFDRALSPAEIRELM